MRTRKNNFGLGELRVTNLVSKRIMEDRAFASFVVESLIRYASFDWGDLSEHDQIMNTQAITDGGQILAAYSYDSSGNKIWIITDADRSYTTILFPDEY